MDNFFIEYKTFFFMLTPPPPPKKKSLYIYDHFCQEGEDLHPQMVKQARQAYKIDSLINFNYTPKSCDLLINYEKICRKIKVYSLQKKVCLLY